MPLMEVNGIRMYYEQAGRGEHTLLLIHGNVASSRWWDRVWEALAERYAVVRMDLRGCGRSDQPGNGYNVPQYSEDVRALVRKLGLGRVIVVGHSMGGAIAMDMAVAEPECVQAMVLVNPAPAEGIVTPEERKPLIEQMIRDRNLMKMALAAVVPTAAQGEFFERLVDDAMIAGPTIIPNYTSLGQADYRDRLAHVNVPALIVYGTQDSLISLDMMERTQDAIPGSELLLYEGVGHSPNVEAPERLVEDVVRFVSRLR
ncbi:alpha/beta fold hydrolase [Effusibacillus pohliae]|uniref:alpha/beta fold hydrolase n=1 Tax=Effusibacillus pohliae TaxID=232270 RepID=UPI000376375D|nr:alpha/beta hydrolase [Effusibacillus pohliae]